MGQATFRSTQGDFSAGILSPRMYAQKTSPFYARGVADAQNMLLATDGSLTRRMPLVYMETLPAGTPENVRVIPWTVNAEDSVLVTIGEGSGQVIVRSEVISVTTQRLLNPSFNSGKAEWTGNGLKAASYAGDSILQDTFSSLNHGYDIVLEQIVAETIEDVAQGTIVVQVQYGRESVPNPDPDFQLLVLVEMLAGGSVIGSTTQYLEWGKRGYISLTVDYDLPNVTPNYGVRVHFDTAGFRFEFKELRIFSCTFTTRQASTPGVVFDSPYTKGQLSKVQYVENPYENQLVLVHPDVPPHELTLSGDGTWGFQPIIFTGPPDLGGANPSCCGSYQGRLYLGGAENYEQTVFGSVPGDWRDFTVGATATDGLEFTLTNKGKVQWIFGHKQLVLGTQYGEHSVFAEDGVIVAGDIDVRMESAAGSRDLQALSVDNELFFVTPSGDTLKSTRYERDSVGWVNTTHSSRASQLFASPVKRLAYTRVPSNIVWALLENGDLLSYTYDRSLDFGGWTHHPMGQTEVQDIATVLIDGADHLVCTCIRATSEGPVATLEFFYGPELLTKGFGFSTMTLDGAIDRTYASPQTLLQGLDWLNGIEVYVWSFGNPIETHLVENGQITTNVASTRFIVGIPVTSVVTTMPTLYNDSSSHLGHGAIKRYAKLGCRIISSSSPVLNVAKGPYAASTPVGVMATDVVPAEDFPIEGTRLIETRVLGADRAGHIQVTQEMPWPMSIVGIYGTVTTGDI